MEEALVFGRVAEEWRRLGLGGTEVMRGLDRSDRVERRSEGSGSKGARKVLLVVESGAYW